LITACKPRKINEPSSASLTIPNCQLNQTPEKQQNPVNSTNLLFNGVVSSRPIPAANPTRVFTGGNNRPLRFASAPYTNNQKRITPDQMLKASPEAGSDMSPKRLSAATKTEFPGTHYNEPRRAGLN
jgi:hypothetical protein